MSFLDCHETGTRPSTLRTEPDHLLDKHGDGILDA